MATVLRVTEKRERSFSANTGTSTSASETVQYQVFFSDSTASGHEASEATTVSDGSVPDYGDDIDGILFLRNKTARRDVENPTVWIVDCTYELPQPGQEAKPDDEETERWAIQVDIHSVPMQREIQRDIYGKPIINSFGGYVPGDAIDGVTVEFYDEEVVVGFTATSVDWTGIDKCIGKINASSIDLNINGQSRTFSAKTLRFVDYAVSYILDSSGVTYPHLQYRLLHRDFVDDDLNHHDWTRELANKSLNQLGPTNDTKIPITDDNGNPVSSAQYISAAGIPLGVGDDAVMLSFDLLYTCDMLTDLLWDIQT